MTKCRRAIVKWVASTPSDWAANRIKALFRDKSDSISIEQLARLEVDHYSIPSFDEFGAPSREDGATIASNKILLKGGEILFSKLNCHKPRIWLVPNDDQVKVASTEFIALSEWHPGSVDKKFISYLLGSAAFANYMTCFQTSVTNSHRRINPNDLWQTSIPFPSLPEQRCVVAYLDAICSSIDAAVVAKRRQLEILNQIGRSLINAYVTGKQKVSGTKLNIQESKWKGDRLKDVALVNVAALSADTDPDYEFDYLEISNVDYNGIIDSGMIEHLRFEDAPSRARRRTVKDCTAISSVRPNLQAVAFLPDGRDDLICSTGFNIVQAQEHKVLPRFIFYALISEDARQYFESCAKGVGYPAVHDKDFGALQVHFPSLDEQFAIVIYLDDQISKLRKLSIVIQKQIASLTDYRQSLVHECVTGQRRITDEDLKKVEQHD